MAQIIKHRRGSLESLSTVTGSLQKGEIVIASGSTNLTASNGNAIAFIVPQDGTVQATNRIIRGTTAPNVFPASTYNGMLNGVPYYASSSSELPTLYLLGSGANEAIDLVGNIQPFSQSVATSINALSSSIGSGTIGNSVNALNTFSASAIISIDALNSSSASQQTQIDGLSGFTGSYATTGSNTFYGAQTISSSFNVSGSTNFNGAVAVDDSNVNLTNSSSLNLTAGSSIYVAGAGVISGSIVGIGNVTAFSTSVDSRLSNLQSKSASVDTAIEALNSYTSSNTSTTALNNFTASAAEKFTEIGVVSGSLISSASAAKSTNDTQDGRLDNIESFSGSANSKFTEIGVVSGSLIASASAASIAIANLNANSGSYALLSGSNIFFGVQTITGSLYITQDLIVQGSSSLQNVTASAVSIGTNQINLNTATPAFRYAGLNVYDSGSSGVSASLQWDSFSDQWIFVHQESGSANVDSSILLYGPLSTGGLGTEATLTGNFLTKIENNGHGHHLTTSSIEDTGTNVKVYSSLEVTGDITVGTSQVALLGGDNLVTSSAQILFTEIDGYTTYSGSVSASFASVIANVGSGVGVSITNLNSFSSSTLGRLSEIESFSSSVETKLTEIGVVSGSLFASASTAKSTNDTQDGRLTNLESTSASVNTSVSNLNTTTASLNTSVSNLNSTTASLNISVAALNTLSASQIISIDALNTVSGSNLGRLSNLETTSASVNISVAALNAYTSSNTSTTALNAFTASAGGRLDNLETTSASVNTSVSNLNSFSSSVLTQLTEIGVVSGSLITSASAAKSTNDTQDGRLSNLETKSASVDTSISNINSFTSSFGTTFSSSVDSRLDTLEGTGTIQGVGQGNEVTFAKVTTTGDVVVGGDLVVQGNTVTLNTSQLIVEDKVITLASGSTSSATADGSGIEVAGANANFVYQHSTTAFTSSVALIAPAVTASVNLGTAAGSSKRIAFRNTNGNLDLVPTASIAGDLLQWDGTDFVMSNTIDGGSF